jgi:SET domain-containing protein
VIFVHRVSYLTSRASVRDAGRKGHGVFAVAPIAAGETIAGWGGEVMDRDAFGRLTEHRRTHSIQIDEHLYMVGPEHPEAADFANHSCAPNAGIVGNILLVAMVAIAAGEEICFDYAMADTDDYDEFVCECGTPQCRRLVTGGDWRIPELQDRYRGFMSSYVERRIAADAGSR